MSSYTHAEAIDRVRELIAGIKVAMLVTRAVDGSLRSRPMAAQEQDFDGTLWFFTASDSSKAAEIEANPEVNLAYVDADRYVSLSGRAELVYDRAKMRELWRPALAEWFPAGVEGPGLELLEVTVTRAEFWDGADFLGKVGKFLHAFTGGAPAEAPDARHESVTLA